MNINKTEANDEIIAAIINTDSWDSAMVEAGQKNFCLNEEFEVKCRAFGLNRSQIDTLTDISMAIANQYSVIGLRYGLKLSGCIREMIGE